MRIIYYIHYTAWMLNNMIDSIFILDFFKIPQDGPALVRPTGGFSHRDSWPDEGTDREEYGYRADGRQRWFLSQAAAKRRS